MSYSITSVSPVFEPPIDGYTKCITVSSTTKSPLPITIMIGYIQSLSEDSEAFNQFISETGSNTEWFKEVKCDNIEDWTRLIEKDSKLQEHLENILIQQCAIDKFDSSNLPLAAKAMQCKIVYNQHTISTDAIPKYTIVIHEDNNTCKLYIKGDEIQELKEAIIQQLVLEREENCSILEKLTMNEPIDLDMINLRKKKITEFNTLIDKLNANPETLSDCLEEMKRENEEMLNKLNAYQPIMKPLFREPQTTIELKKIPCMDCKESDKMIKEFSCGHISCSDCIIARISDLRDTKKAFVLKCIIPYCFNILHTEELQEMIDNKLYQEILAENIFKKTPESCLICQKKADVILHDNHTLCKDCLLSYLKYKTNNEMVNIDPITKAIETIECPIFEACRKNFTYLVYEDLVPNLRDLIKIATRKVTLILEEKKHPNEDTIGKCFECGAIKEIAKLHVNCNICFCKNHFKELGKKIHKNDSKN